MEDRLISYSQFTVNRCPFLPFASTYSTLSQLPIYSHSKSLPAVHVSMTQRNIFISSRDALSAGLISEVYGRLIVWDADAWGVWLGYDMDMDTANWEKL